MLENSSLSTLESISHYTNVTINTAIDGRVGGETHTRDGTAYLELAAFVCIDMVGLVGNGFVFGVVLLCKEMRTVANFFVVSLSVADILVSALVTPIVIATRWKRMWLLGAAACDLQAIINHTCMFASLFNLAAIAVSRLVVTRRPGRYHSLFSTNHCCLYISIIWCFSIVYSLLPVMGWGEFRYDAKRYNCIFSREAAPSYSLFFATCCVLLPQLVCATSYVMVLVTFVQSQSALESIQDVIVVRNARSEWKLTKNLFVVWLAFFLSWLPMNVLFFIDPKGELNEQVYTVAVWLMLSNSCVNPIIYGVQNRNFRQGYLNVIEKVSRRFRKSRVSPGTSLTRNGSTRSDRNQTTGSTSTRSRVRSDLLQLPQSSGPHGRPSTSRDLSQQL